MPFGGILKFGALSHVMMRHQVYLVILLLFLTPTLLLAQEDNGDAIADADAEEVQPSGDEGRADRLFFNENYKEALREYLMVLEEKPEDTKINYNTGLCYLNSDFEKIKAVPFFEKVVFYDEEAATVYYLIGKAYQSDLQFDRAIDMFNRYIEYYSIGAEFSVEEAEMEIEYCENAYELMKFPVSCTYENLGPEINSEYPDYFPFVTIDESFLVYTTKRDDGSEKLPDGTYSSNIYYTKVVDGEYAPAIHMPGADNEPGESEVVVGMSLDGTGVLLMKGLESVSGDIYEADFSSDHLENLDALSDKVNSRWREIAATYGQDRNTIYFVSDRPGGYGGTDIWVVKKLPTLKWGVPFNAGPHINTERDEDFPNLSPDGQFLYFSSKGHFSMGGYDIFRAKWDSDSNMFVGPRNLGYPVNSVDDDMNYRVSKSGRYGYISALREDGYGDYDIYRLTISEIDAEISVLRGVLSSTNEGIPLEGASITVSDLASGELYGIYAPNPSSMRYVVALEPGEYDVLITAEGFEPASFEVKILGKSSFQSEIIRDLKLNPE